MLRSTCLLFSVKRPFTGSTNGPMKGHSIFKDDPLVFIHVNYTLKTAKNQLAPDYGSLILKSSITAVPSVSIRQLKAAEMFRAPNSVKSFLISNLSEPSSFSLR